MYKMHLYAQQQELQARYKIAHLLTSYIIILVDLKKTLSNVRLSAKLLGKGEEVTYYVAFPIRLKLDINETILLYARTWPFIYIKAMCITDACMYCAAINVHNIKTFSLRTLVVYMYRI